MQEEHTNGQTGVRQIGAVRVDFEALTISGADGTTSLEPKVMAVLSALVAEAPAVVTREALIERVWGGESGGDESLSRAISLLRKALGDRRGQHSHIETIPRRGYRLVADVGRPAEAVVSDQTVGAAGGHRRWIAFSVVAVLICLGVAYWYSRPALDRPPEDAVIEPPDRSIAVLPFADLSPAGDQAYFADGLAEEILNAMVGVSELKVTGRTSSFAYRERDIDLRALGVELGVRHVLEGSVRKEGDRLRITAQLVRTDDGFHSWSRTFDGSINRVFDFQEEIARDIARALEISLSPADSKRLAPTLTVSQTAYDAFLQGRNLARRFGPDEKIRAAELLEQAVTIDPSFAHAWAELARTELFIPISNPEEALEPRLSRAREAAGRALAIDPELAISHFVQGLVYESDLDYAAAMQSFSRAYRLEPGNPFLTIRYGYYLALLGHLERGAEIMEQGLQLDPTDAAGIANFGFTKLALGEPAEAKRLISRSVDLGFVPVSGALAQLLAGEGGLEEAWDVWRRSIELSDRYIPGFEDPEVWDMFGSWLIAQDADARAEVTAAFASYFSSEGALANSYRLWTLVQLGQPGLAMKLLQEKPYPINAGFVSAIWQDGFGFAALRQHPEFPAFVERIGLIEAWDEYGWPARCRRVPQVNEEAPSVHCD